MASDKTSTLVLTSAEKLGWHSMREAVPMVENGWIKSHLSSEHEVRTLDCAKAARGEIALASLKAQNVVLPYFSRSVIKAALEIRKTLQSDARFIVHLFDQATKGLWPYHVAGLGELFRTDDVFIATCSRDVEIMKLNFKNPRTEVVPFSFSDIGLPLGKMPVSPCLRGEVIPLAYIGRISAQKNIHGLLHALKTLRDTAPDLEFSLELFGEEDDLGSPSHGWKPMGYGESLRRICIESGLSGQVSFRGFLPRERLFAELNTKKHLCLSTSLHSDENFGLSLFRALCYGHAAVISDWGGHRDFREHFSDRLLTIPVAGSKSGPFIEPLDFAYGIERAVREIYFQSHTPKIPPYYQEEEISERLRGFATEPLIPGRALLVSPLVQELLASRHGDQIFSSYEDPRAHLYFRNYGMDKPSRLADFGLSIF